MPTRRVDPPDVVDVLDVLEHLRPVAPAAAAVHLLTPVEEIVGVQARMNAGRLWWRGEHTPLEADGELADMVGRVAGLVGRVRNPGDMFIDLAGPPSGWCKPVRSGAFVHILGTVDLFAGPHVTCEVDVPDAVVLAVCALAAERHPLPAGHAVLGGTRVLVTCGARSAHVALAG